jgi:hypothetical protein
VSRWYLSPECWFSFPFVKSLRTAGVALSPSSSKLLSVNQRINQELVSDFKEVTGKTNILFRLAEVAVAQPEGTISQVIYPVVSQKTLLDLVAEYKATGTAYRQRVHTVIRNSYANHYRRMIPQLLAVLEFRSNNDIHRPVIQALELLKKYTDSKARYYEPAENIPIDGVLKSGWKEILLETDTEGRERINRINYEISVLQALRERLSCKEIWVVGANRYGNPDRDLPLGFDSPTVRPDGEVCHGFEVGNGGNGSDFKTV